MRTMMKEQQENLKILGSVTLYYHLFLYVLVLVNSDLREPDGLVLHTTSSAVLVVTTILY